MVKKADSARKESEVLAKISDWCASKFPDVDIEKAKIAKFIEKTGQTKLIDATIIGNYKKKRRSGAEKLLIGELEFEEHRRKYSIIEKMHKINVPYRKLYYGRNDIPQYWIKIDADGSPIMINYRYIYENRHNWEDIGAHGKYTEPDQTKMIIAAEKDSNGNWPSYVIIGWKGVFKELGRVIKKAGF